MRVGYRGRRLRAGQSGVRATRASAVALPVLHRDDGHTPVRPSLAEAFDKGEGTAVAADIRAVAIPRLDPEGRGVHVAWSGPDLLPLAIYGYEVRRRRFEPLAGTRRRQHGALRQRPTTGRAK